MATWWQCIEYLHCFAAIELWLWIYWNIVRITSIFVFDRRLSWSWHSARSLCVPSNEVCTIFIGHIEWSKRQPNNHSFKSKYADIESRRFHKNPIRTIQMDPFRGKSVCFVPSYPTFEFIISFVFVAHRLVMWPKPSKWSTQLSNGMQQIQTNILWYQWNWKIEVKKI